MKEKRIFTEDEEKYIVDNWGKESIYSMRKIFNCSWDSIANVGKKYGLELPTANLWSEEEVNRLIELSEEYSLDEIATIMNKTKEAIYLKSRRLNITLRMNRREWTKEEEKILKECWGVVSLENLSKKLKRSIYSLKVKAIRMKLGAMRLNNTDVLLLSDVCDILGVSLDRVYRWKKYGLKTIYKKVTSKKGYTYVAWDDLLTFLEEHQDLWDSNNVELYMLGEEYDWLKLKRKKDALNKPLTYKFWNSDEKVDIVNYFKLGYSYEDIAKLVKRSTWSVTNFLNSNGYYISKRDGWSEEDIKFLKDNYMIMTYDDLAQELHKSKRSVEYQLSKQGCIKRVLKKNK